MTFTVDQATPDDAAAVAAAVADRAVVDALALPDPPSVAAVAGWLASQVRDVRLIRPSTAPSTVAGGIVLSPSGASTWVAWWTAPGWRRRGVLTSTLPAVLDQIGSAVASVDTANVASSRLAAAVGFVPSRRLPDGAVLWHRR